MEEDHELENGWGDGQDGSDQEDVVMDIELEFIIAIINSNSMSIPDICQERQERRECKIFG